MGKRDYGHRESKKSRKEAKKSTPISTILESPAEVEVIRKSKKGRGEEEERG